jgi:hypothetical protein
MSSGLLHLFSFFLKKLLPLLTIYVIVSNRMNNKSRTFTFQIDPEIRAALEQEAAEKERSVAFLINRRLRSSLEADQYLLSKSAVREPRTSSAQVQDI